MAGATKLLTAGGGGVILTPASSIASDVTVSLPTTNGITLVGGTNGIAPEASGGTGTTTGYYGFKNRIINGAMLIDQRKGGASVTPTTVSYTLDRWQATLSVSSKFSVQQNAGSVTPPAGFINYLGATSLSAYSVGATETFAISQPIEGLNIADLGWGTANAQSVTLSFWVRSSLTGTFGGSLRNSASDRSYPFTYTISAANTWEQKSITIAGDTTGTWLTTNGLGVQVIIGLGSGSTRSGTAGSWAAANYTNATGATSVVGTNGATFYITGVQLEKGSTATSFDYRPYGTELALCQRYYYKSLFDAAGPRWGVCFCYATTAARCTIPFKVTMRTAPTALEQTGTATDYCLINAGGGVVNCSSVPTWSTSNEQSAEVVFTVASGLVGGNATQARSNAANAYLAWSAEL